MGAENPLLAVIMMSRLKFTLKLLGMVCVAGPCLGLTYRWSDNGAGHDWDTAANWLNDLDAPSYPDSASDDPVIPVEPDDPNNYPDGCWLVDLVDIEELGDMTIHGNVAFGAADPNRPTIEPNTLTLDASEREEVLVVEMSDGRILVGPSPTE